MQRRKFVQAGALAATLPLATFVQASAAAQVPQREWYELRKYELKFRGDQSILLDYLKNVLKPAVTRAGANHFMLFTELGLSEPSMLWLWIGYPSIDAYQSAQDLSGDDAFIKASQSYNDLDISQALYNRYGSWLLRAFDGLPKALDPINGAGFFELRTYESFSEDALRRKIKMFNTEELELFYKLKLNPVFFSEMIAGPYRPCLTYMINFKDQQARNSAWEAFIKHPDWITMSAKQEYKDAMNNIRKTFLVPV